MFKRLQEGITIATRRVFIGRLAGFVMVGSSGKQLLAQLADQPTGPTPITIYKSSSCLCCAKWVEHVRAGAFVPSIHDEEDLDEVKDLLGVPKPVRSCHTALVEDYLIEGHVPASDIRRLLKERPKIAGVAVPGMPTRTPGMAEAGDKIGGFEVIAFQSDGAMRAFAYY